MKLLSPDRLWLLVPVAAVAVAHLWLQRRRRRKAVRHPDLALMASVAPRRAGWRRYATAGLLLFADAALVLGLARPAYSTEVPRDEAVIVLAIDVSFSMDATDVAPTRLQAAVKKAEAFIDQAPASYRIGLVAFDTSGHTIATPTTDKASLHTALEGLTTGLGTAGGEGLFTALDVLDAATAADSVIASEVPYRAVVLLADGASTTGRSLDDAAAVAAQKKVPVYTITFGTASGSVVINGVTHPVPAEPGALASVADTTGGQDFTASSGAQLGQVYDRIGTSIGTVTDDVELTVPLAALAAALLALALVTSMRWSPRLV